MPPPSAAHSKRETLNLRINEGALRPRVTMGDPISVWLRRQHAASFVAILLAATHAAGMVGFLVSPAETASGPAALKSMSLGWRLVFASLVAPLVETAIYQWLPIRKLRLRSCWGVLLSASMFGLSHWYSWSYVLAAFLVGLVFAYGYAVRDQSTGKPFVLVAIAHAIHNGVASILIS